METGRSSERRDWDSPSQMTSTVPSRRAVGLGAQLEPRTTVPGSWPHPAPPLRRHGGDTPVEELMRAAVSLCAGVERGSDGCPGPVLEVVLETQGWKTVP